MEIKRQAENAQEKNLLELDGREMSKQGLASLYVRSANRITSKAIWAYMLLLIVSITTLMAVYNEWISFSQRFVKMSVYAHGKEIRELCACQQTLDSLNRAECDASETLAVKNRMDSLRMKLCDGDTNRINEQTIPGRLVLQYVDNFVESQYFTFPVIGIKISTSDVFTILSLCMSLVFAWCYFCIVNENRIVGKILNRTVDYPLHLKQYILSGIAFSNIFFPVSYRNNPYERLEHRPDTLVRKLRVMERKEARYEKKVVMHQSAVAWCLFFIPVLFVLVGLVFGFTDLGSFGNMQSLLENIYRLGTDPELYRVADHLVSYSIWIRGSLIFSALLLGLMIYLACRIIVYVRSTSSVLFDYKNTIKYETELNAICKTCVERQCRNFDLRLFPVKGAAKWVQTGMAYGFSLYVKRVPAEKSESDRRRGVGTVYGTAEIERILDFLDILVAQGNSDEREIDVGMVKLLREKLAALLRTMAEAQSSDEPFLENPAWACILLEFKE